MKSTSRVACQFFRCLFCAIRIKIRDIKCARSEKKADFVCAFSSAFLMHESESDHRASMRAKSRFQIDTNRSDFARKLEKRVSSNRAKGIRHILIIDTRKFPISVDGANRRFMITLPDPSRKSANRSREQKRFRIFRQFPKKTQFLLAGDRVRKCASSVVASSSSRRSHRFIAIRDLGVFACAIHFLEASRKRIQFQRDGVGENVFFLRVHEWVFKIDLAKIIRHLLSVF